MRKRQVVVVASAAGCLLIFLWLMSEWRMSRFHPPAGANLHRLGELELYAIDEQSESLEAFRSHPAPSSQELLAM